MKKLLFLLLISGSLSAQVLQPNTAGVFQQLSSPTGWLQANGTFYAYRGIVLAEYTDTTAANLSTIKNSAGSIIRVGSKIYVRNQTATGWGEAIVGYPGAGIAVSTGAAWGTSITDNSANWNTAFTDRLKWDGGPTGLVAATARTSLGITTIGDAYFRQTNPSAITYIRQNADNTISALDAATFRTAIGAGTGGGTVTSVAALTLGTTGTDLSSSVANGTTTPVITLNVPTASAVNRGALSAADWTTFNNKGSGSVTTVSFTGGLISVANPTTTPALTVAGTSGGIPYFSSTSTWASSALLASNALMIGGGAGVAPSTITTGTGVVTALGVNTGSVGAVVLFNGALGTPSSGTVTNLTGTASININGTVGATTPTTGAFTTVTASTSVTTPSLTSSGNLAISPAGGTTTLTGILRVNIGNNSKTSDWIGATTGYQYFIASNTGANFQYGIDASTGGQLATGSLAYSSSVLTGNATALHLGTTSIVRMTIFSGGNVAIGTTTDAASAILNVASTTKGFLPPRMTATQASAIASPAEALLVYVTDTNGTFTVKGWWGYNGAAWEKLNN